MSNWISVKDKLPENLTIVDVWIKSHDNPDYGNRKSEILYNKEFHAGLTWSGCYVSHWMIAPDGPEDCFMKNKDEIPLRSVADNGEIQILIGEKVLAFAAANHPDFWDGESGPKVPNIKVTDINKFAAEVLRAINTEDEDGSTLLTRMLDEAIAEAVESGCDGVDHE